VTQGFSRVPFVGYRAHRSPLLSPGLWRLHSVEFLKPPRTPLPPSPLSVERPLSSKHVLLEPTLQLTHLDQRFSHSCSPPASPAAAQSTRSSPRLLVEPSTSKPVRTRSRESSRTRKLMEKGRIFEEKIEAEAVAWRWGTSGSAGSGSDAGNARGSDAGGDESPFADGCASRMDSAAMAVSKLDANDYLQHVMRRNPYADGYDKPILPATHWEAERRTDAEERWKVTEKESEDLKRMGAWYRLLRKVLETFGFTRSEFDHD
jgi:hypothetical protein